MSRRFKVDRKYGFVFQDKIEAEKLKRYPNIIKTEKVELTAKPVAHSADDDFRYKKNTRIMGDFIIVTEKDEFWIRKNIVIMNAWIIADDFLFKGNRTSFRFYLKKLDRNKWTLFVKTDDGPDWVYISCYVDKKGKLRSPRLVNTAVFEIEISGKRFYITAGYHY
ncbi:hypothetical protein KKF34_03705 [Myxococcota bacterium]|nr:hypothetical protein [Myxococcota bacterium]MBU1382450.1 hypothetical protein [Myxococcota bacterium]MBU1495961.1 hypothetical protein [Myxococcota bacterium]